MPAFTRHNCSAESRSDLTLQFLRASIHGAARQEHLALLSGNRPAIHADGCLGTAALYYQNPVVIRQNSTRVPGQANRTNNSSVDPAIALRRIEEDGRSDSDQHYTASHRHGVRKLCQIRSGPNEWQPRIMRCVRNDDEGHPLEARLGPFLRLSIAAAFPGSASEVHSGCDPGGST
jgi:hypothetical protein